MRKFFFVLFQALFISGLVSGANLFGESLLIDSFFGASLSQQVPTVNLSNGFSASVLRSDVSTTTSANIPEAIQCYEKATNSENIENYMSCFVADATIIDVGRKIEGYSDIKRWALREVISYGKSFEHRKVLEQKKGYAKTEVKWRSWVVHYYYWWDKNDKLVKMDLQYAN